MISKQQAKFVKSLKLKKYRKKASCFLVEGAKNVIELLSSDYEIQNLYVTNKFLLETPNHLLSNVDFQICTEKELADIGTFQTNEYALAVANIKSVSVDFSKENLILALDVVSDPGNLGTIIRIADWYGIKTIVASLSSADFYNPKVINASMGSFCRIDIHYMELEYFLSSNIDREVFGAMLKGEDVHGVQVNKPSILLMGNESNGISSALNKFINRKITIPKFGHAESLNVAISTAIICDNLIRK